MIAKEQSGVLSTKEQIVSNDGKDHHGLPRMNC